MGSQQVICYTLITNYLSLQTQQTQNMKLCLFLLLSLSTSYCQAIPSHEVNNRFILCKSDADCPEQMTCDDHYKQCKRGCKSDADCPEKMMCDNEYQECIPKDIWADCESNADCTEPLMCIEMTAGKKCNIKCMKTEECPINSFCSVYKYCI